MIQGSFSPKKVARQYPLLAGMHRAADGALLGVLIVVLIFFPTGFLGKPDIEKV